MDAIAAGHDLRNAEIYLASSCVQFCATMSCGGAAFGCASSCFIIASCSNSQEKPNNSSPSKRTQLASLLPTRSLAGVLYQVVAEDISGPLFLQSCGAIFARIPTGVALSRTRIPAANLAYPLSEKDGLTRFASIIPANLKTDGIRVEWPEVLNLALVTRFL